MSTTAEKIAVMQAYERGEEIECATRWAPNDYEVTHDPSWDFLACNYRIKPKPREWWVNVSSTELRSSIGLFAYDTIELANAFNSAAECVHVREVIE